jgi:hypothetical protein
VEPLAIVPRRTDDRPVPNVPTGCEWLESTRQAWEGYWSSDVGALADSVDAAMAMVTFETLDQFTRCARAWRKQPYVEGSKNQTVLNPAGARMDRLSGEVRQNLVEMGATLSVRTRLNLVAARTQLTLAELNAVMEDDDRDPGSADPREAAVLEPAEDG